ncbi:hypothetical protein [Arthrobacter methylotrophus]|uniref:hypothetical protein n=1 Tax=Arthrobacter methylotrophus TaxID=121291 RepID=UPI0031F04B7E
MRAGPRRHAVRAADRRPVPRRPRKTLAVAHALEQAFEASATLRRPRPDLAKLAQPTPALQSIVTAPPVFDAVTRSTGASAV